MDEKTFDVEVLTEKNLTNSRLNVKRKELAKVSVRYKLVYSRLLLKEIIRDLNYKWGKE